MRDANGQRLQLKSKLLIGVAGMTAAAMSTAAFAADAAPPAADTSAAPTPAPVAAPTVTPAPAMKPIDPPKWLPYIDIGGGVGSGFAIGRANAFVPVWQDLDSLMFVRFGAATTSRNNSNNDFNIGAGYRTKIDSEWILGAFAGFDSTQTNYDHTFNQFSLGVEAMSADWDIRANAYLAKKTNRAIGDKFQLYIHDTAIAILQGQEGALSGFDGEIGYRVFNTETTDVRVFAGAYTFHHADVNTTGVGTNFSFPYRDIEGPKLRAEVNVFDLDMLGPQSRLSIEGQVSHDNVNHTSEYIGATLRIALDDTSGPGAQALDDLDRRMADPVRRSDNVLTQWQFNKPEPVIIYNSTLTSKPTNTLYYAEQRSGAGAGSYADQTTIQDATTRGGSGKNAFIVLTDAGGGTIDATGTTVKSGETLTGAGTFKVRGADSTFPVFTHDFAPGSGAVTLGTTSGNVLNLAGDANIANLSIAGPFVDGIYGANVGDVNIVNVNIDGGGVGTNGIVFKQTDTSGTANVAVSNTAIKGVTNDGLDMDVSASSGATSTTILVGDRLTIGTGHDGLSLTASSSGASNATVYAVIHDSSITGGNTGLNQSATTAGGTLTQTLVVDPSVVSGGAFGIYIDGATAGGALTQNFTDVDGTISGGFSVYGKAHGGSLIQNVQAANITVPSSQTPLSIGAYADSGSIVQNLTLTHVTADGGANNNIEIDATGYDTAHIAQTVSLSHVHASNAGYNGVYATVYAYDGATVLQTVNIDDLTAGGNAGYGVRAIAGAYSPTSKAPSVAGQYLTIDGASLSGNSYAGIGAEVGATANAVARQDLNVLNATIQNNLAGIEIKSDARDGASSQQNIYLAYDTVTHNIGDGIDIEALGTNGNGFAAQYGTIYNVDVSYSGLSGIYIRADATAADAEQQLYVEYVTATHEGANGIQIVANATDFTTGSYTTYPAHAEQDINILYSDLSHNPSSGLSIGATAQNRAQIDQTVFAYDTHMDDNGVAGAALYAYALGPSTATYANGEKTVLNTTLEIEGGSTADRNAGPGVLVFNVAKYATTLTGTLTIDGSEAVYNGSSGVIEAALASGYLSENLSHVTLSGSTFAHNSGDGVTLIASQYDGPGPYGLSDQIVTIADSDFSHNARDGLYLRLSGTGFNGRAEGHLTISGSDFSQNGENGIESFAYAGGGSYVPGYACPFYVQGTAGGCAVVRETIDIDGSTLDNNGRFGILLNSAAENYGAIYSVGGRSFVPSLSVSNSTIDDNPQAGIGIANSIYRHSYQFQYIAISNTKITANGIDGGPSPVYANTHLFGPYDTSILQGGLSIASSVEKYSLQAQYVFVRDGSVISNNKGAGITLRTEGVLDYDIANTLAVYDSAVNGNYTGVAQFMLAKHIQGNVTQQFYAKNSVFSDNIIGCGCASPKYAGSGAVVFLDAEDVQGAATQNINLLNNAFTGNEHSGLAADFINIKDVSSKQHVTSVDDIFTGNAHDGLDAHLNIKYGGPTAANYIAEQKVILRGDTFDAASGKLGAYIAAYSGSATATQLVYVYNDASGRGSKFSNADYSPKAGGLNVYGATYGTGTLAATVSVTGAKFDDSSNGIYIYQLGNNYEPTAGIDVSGNIFTGNNGGFFARADDADQTIKVQGNSFYVPALSYGIGALAENSGNQDINVHTNAQSGLGVFYAFSAPTGTQTVTY